MNMRIVIILLLFAPFCLLAQSNFKQGYLITQRGDTLNGFIDYKEWRYNPDKVRFKHSLQNVETQIFTADDLHSFRVVGYESYSKFTLHISMNEVAFENLTEAVDTTSTVKTVFLKEVLRGDRISLYSYRDAVKNRFYVLSKGKSMPEELLYRKTLKGLEENTEELFKQQLTELAVTYGTISAQTERLINSAAYAAIDLKNVISKINTTNETHINHVLEKKGKTGFFAGIGVTKNKITFTGKNMVTVDGLEDLDREKHKKQVTQAYLPRFSAGIDLYLNPAIQKSVIRMEVSAAKMKSTVKSYYKYSVYTTYETENTYTLLAWNFAFTPQLLYNLYNTPKFKFYVGAGASFNYFHPTKNSLYRREINPPATETEDENYFIMKKYSLSFVVRSGIRLNQRIDLSLLWGNQEEYTNFLKGNSSIKSGLLAFSAGYSFGK